MLNSEQKQNGLYCNFIAVKDNKAYKISEISVPDLVTNLCRHTGCFLRPRNRQETVG